MRLLLWRCLVWWYHQAVKIERRLGMPKTSQGWAVLRAWHHYAVWLPLVWSHRVGPWQHKWTPGLKEYHAKHHG